MGKTHETKWACDLCKKEDKTSNNTPPSGWTEFDTEDRFLDRSWNTHVVCDGCTAKIIKSHK